MIDKNSLGFISSGLAVVGYGSYIFSVLRGKTKPHLLSWTAWSILMAAVCWAQLSRGAGAGGWSTGVSAGFCLMVAVLALRWGDRHITRSDWIAFAGALVTIPVWYVTQDPLHVVLLATVIDGFAYYSTLRKAWLRPQEEDFTLYTIDLVKWTIALCALDHYALVTLLYPFFIMATNAVLVMVIVVRRRLRG